MLSVESGQIKALERDLGVLSKRAQPYAEVNTLTGMARAGQKIARGHVNEEFINRNSWTARSIQFERATLTKRYAVLGSVAPYMGKQEFGGSKSAQGKYGAPIPTKAASGESRGGQMRKKLIQRKSLMKNITLTNRQIRMGHTNGQRQRNAIAVTTALRKGGGDVFLHLQRRRGLFRVSGTRKNAKIEMLYDLSHPQVLLKKHAWLYPSMVEATQRGSQIYVAQLTRQIELAKLFKAGKFKR